MLLTKAIILALASITSLASAQEYLHPHALQARAFDAGYEAGLEARWAEPEPYADAEPGDGSREGFVSEAAAICKGQLRSCIRLEPPATKRCRDAYNACVKQPRKGINAKGPKG
ncbi:hypothetical protein MMC32_008141 [Xylographa parallela]|nr:hypothetical protein [Xylographa parallela]